MELAATVARSGDSDTETPPRAQPTGFLAYANGPVKRHYPTAPRREREAVSYKECLRNHAASIGGHALDGCCEFMPSPTASSTDPTSLKCAACGCHRNFHRRDPDDPSPIHQHPVRHPSSAPPPRQHSNSPPPPPNSMPYNSSASHMLLALSQNPCGPSTDDHHHHHPSAGAVTATTANNSPHGKKRFRTKFSPEQKEKMLEFSEKLGWKMQKSDESLVEEFCNEVGVGKGVLKVWMHNNKHTFARRENNHITDDENNNGGNGFYFNGHKVSGNGGQNDDNYDTVHVSTNGSSSSA
ncbi:hypothetical protein Nepgr_003557 [Nepenthes gracilis]|uniref:ZF-HD dimerization-type domain-containing protein n=1 Tax=Nepenthes gracilis TaxID=150966 RepID=A0AAD3RZQ4_NEPGR|nr:hypothetical protein Nepgr_003557 [Nepenthes gracilis]